MALIEVSYCLIDQEDIFELLCDSFDEIKEVRDEPFYNKKTFRVRHEEITEDDIVICPVMIQFDGIKPFIISFDAQ